MPGSSEVIANSESMPLDESSPNNDNVSKSPQGHDGQIQDKFDIKMKSAKHNLTISYQNISISVDVCYIDLTIIKHYSCFLSSSVLSSSSSWGHHLLIYA